MQILLHNREHKGRFTPESEKIFSSKMMLFPKVIYTFPKRKMAIKLKFSSNFPFSSKTYRNYSFSRSFLNSKYAMGLSMENLTCVNPVNMKYNSKIEILNLITCELIPIPMQKCLAGACWQSKVASPGFFQGGGRPGHLKAITLPRRGGSQLDGKEV